MKLVQNINVNFQKQQQQQQKTLYEEKYNPLLKMIMSLQGREVCETGPGGGGEMGETRTPETLSPNLQKIVSMLFSFSGAALSQFAGLEAWGLGGIRR